MQPCMLLDAAHKVHLMHLCSKNGRAGKHVNYSWDAHVTLMRLKIPISCKVLFLQRQCGDTSLAVGQKLQHMSAGVSATPHHAAIILMPESKRKAFPPVLATGQNVVLLSHLLTSVPTLCSGKVSSDPFVPSTGTSASAAVTCPVSLLLPALLSSSEAAVC